MRVPWGLLPQHHATTCTNFAHIEMWSIHDHDTDTDKNHPVTRALILDLTMIYFSRIKIMSTYAFMYTHSGCSVWGYPEVFLPACAWPSCWERGERGLDLWIDIVHSSYEVYALQSSLMLEYLLEVIHPAVAGCTPITTCVNATHVTQACTWHVSIVLEG